MVEKRAEELTDQLFVLPPVEGELELDAGGTFADSVSRDVILRDDVAAGEGREAFCREVGEKLLSEIAHLGRNEGERSFVEEWSLEYAQEPSFLRPESLISLPQRRPETLPTAPTACT